jgi:hypothetical protein
MDARLGQQMEQLWASELLPAWNMKVSLEKQGKSPRAHLEERFAGDVVQAALSRRATPESSIARVFTKREHISEGRARNALREYGKLTGRKKFVPLV